MTDTEDLCPWSELPRSMCEHCRPPGHAPEAVTAEMVGRQLFGPGGPFAKPAPQLHMRVVHPVRRQPPVAIVGAVAIDTSLIVDVLDCVTDLTTATIRRESFSIAHTNDDGSTTWIQRRHRTTSPSLLEQLWGAVEASGSAETGQRVFASKPSARIDAIDAAQRIDTGAFTWLRKLGMPDVYDDKTVPDTAAAVRRLGSLLPSTEKCSRTKPDRDKVCCTRHHIELDIRSWWSAARVLTGWDSAAWKPANSCPVCEIKGGLRVKLDAHTGVCVECWSTWTPDTIGLLADHIRAENHEDEADDSGTTRHDPDPGDTPRHAAC